MNRRKGGSGSGSGGGRPSRHGGGGGSRMGGGGPGNGGGRGRRGGGGGSRYGGGGGGGPRRPMSSNVPVDNLPEFSDQEPIEAGEPLPLEHGRGILELHPNGYGFLRSSENHYAANALIRLSRAQ